MLRQTQSFKLQQKLSPQQIQLMKLIQLNNTALEERIKEEMVDNPALEEGKEQENEWDELKSEDDKASDEQIEKDEILDLYTADDYGPDYRQYANNRSSDDEERSVPLAGGISFFEFLDKQISERDLDEKKEQIARYLVGSLEEDGYLRRSIPDITDDLAFRQNLMTTDDEVLEILEVIQDFDPPGVGARDLQECLIIQLERKQSSPVRQIALQILDYYFDEFQKKHYEKLASRLDITPDELKEAYEEIRHLNPKPGNAVPSNSKPTEVIIPDFLISVYEGEVELTLNSKHTPDLFVNRSYREALDHYKSSKGKVSKRQKEEVTFIKHKLDSARWFIDAIKQRQQTLYLTMSAIIERQKAYFLSGDEKDLRPMILKDIADEIQMDISTVSRVASNKYFQSPYGTFLIKKLFSESMKNDKGEDVSTREIKKILEEVIEDEDKKKPMTDEALAKLLKEKGYPIARRTVAKYREQLDLPVARMRKQI